MLTARSMFQQIHGNNDTFRLFCSIAAKGESQGGWENARIAALCTDPHLTPRIARHGADEDKHGRLFNAMLTRRNLTPVDVPPDTDYCMQLEHQGIGLAHTRLTSNEPLTTNDLITYLAHSRVTEQRAAEDMRLLRHALGDNPDIGKSLHMICDDEENHLAYCHEELLRLAATSPRNKRRINDTLRTTARAEIRVNRDVSLAVTRRMADILGWSRTQRALLTAGIHTVYAYDRIVGLRRLTRLAPPARRDALGTPHPVPAG